MNITLEKKVKNSSKNHVYIVQNLTELKALKLSKKNLSYFSEKLKAKSLAHINDAGTYTFIVPFSSLNKKNPNGYPNREGLRKLGNLVYSILKNEAESVSVEGKSALATTLFLEGFTLSDYTFDKYKKKKSETKLKTVFVTNTKVNASRISISTEATHWARYLVNEPVSFLTAEELSNQVKSKCKGTGIKVEILEKAKIEALQMGGLLAVNKGSFDPPTFTIMEWAPKKAKNKKPIVLVGKGVVYDTGGLSLKPTANSMDQMKCDMGGAAMMAATTYAIAKLKLPLHIITLLPATDNRPGKNAYAPGDVVTMFDKTTVEVLNTDAEGRMILADALAYSNKFKPEIVIDAATLTGAAARAIGTHASVSMGNAKQEELDLLEKAGQISHDRVVQFPFWEEWGEEMKSDIADLKNLGGASAGMITAGKFLEHFVKAPYIHIDIAGPAFLTGRDSYRGKGGTGVGVRLLIEYFTLKS
ncbi:MAG: M17 family metallopeptidase [Crocinitomicaceae bacterium]|nr:M17 family metallopeptidase [Crocinitomicaceae bacterium]